MAWKRKTARSWSSRGRATKVKPRHRSARAVRRSLAPRAHSVLQQLPRPYEYEDVLLNAVVHGTGEQLGPDSAVIVDAIASMTPSLRALHFGRGMRSGRALYSLCARLGEHRDAMLCLPDFMEHAGYSDVRFERLGALFRVVMRASGPDISGANVHTFEAGLLSGFMGAAEGRRVVVSETSCSLNGSDHCVFEPAPPRQGRVKLESAMHSIASHLASGRDDRKVINRYYCNLLWGTLLNAEYDSEMRGVVRYCGAVMRVALEGLDRDPIKEAKSVVEMLGLGKVEVSNGKRFSASISFDSVSAKRSFMEMSMSFLSGLLGGAPVEITEAASSYSISVQQ